MLRTACEKVVVNKTASHYFSSYAVGLIKALHTFLYNVNLREFFKYHKPYLLHVTMNIILCIFILKCIRSFLHIYQISVVFNHYYLLAFIFNINSIKLFTYIFLLLDN